MYLRLASLLITATAALMFSGCCCVPPMGGGCFNGYPTSCETDCNGCETCGTTDYGMGYGVPRGPLETMQMWRSNLFCGSGCGDIYQGEWRGTLPNGADMCCGDQWGGAAYPCLPACWHPGLLLGNLYGKRLCGGCGDSYGACGCGGMTSGGGYQSDCGCSEDVYSEAEYIESTSSARMARQGVPTPMRASRPPTTSRPQGVPSRSRITRAAGARRMSSRQN
jgi:hypothetical protein